MARVKKAISIFVGVTISAVVMAAFFFVLLWPMIYAGWASVAIFHMYGPQNAK